MDNLEILKAKWKSGEQELPKLSYNEIYKMILKKSSTIIKWILIISICEIAFWTLLSFFIPESSKDFNNEMGLKKVFTVITIFNYAVVLIFIYLFYNNYKKINVTNNIKKLMENIINTRKTVHYFVYYNIGMTTLILIATNVYYYFNQDRLSAFLNKDETFGAIPAETFINVSLISGIIVLGLLILFYWLIYGILLRKLKRNYKELKKMDS